MPLTLSPLLESFAERTPLPVMGRAVLERSFPAAQLDAWFDKHAEGQYTRVYAKLNGLEPGTLAALVAESAARSREVIR